MAVNDVLRTHRVQQLLAASTSYLNQQAREQGRGRSQVPPEQGQQRSRARFFGGAFTEAYEQGYANGNGNIDVDNSELVYNDDDEDEDGDDGAFHDMDIYDGGVVDVDVDDDDDPSSFLFEGEPMNTYPPHPSLPFRPSPSHLLPLLSPTHSPIHPYLSIYLSFPLFRDRRKSPDRKIPQRQRHLQRR